MCSTNVYTSIYIVLSACLIDIYYLSFWSHSLAMQLFVVAVIILIDSLYYCRCLVAIECVAVFGCSFCLAMQKLQ